MPRAFLTIFILLSAPPLATAMDGAAEREIGHLIAYLKGSSCAFYRNGTWYGADAAADHMETKLRYLTKRGLVDSAETFVALAASRSSMTGRPYRVKCGDDAPVDSGDWFKKALQQYRQRTP